MQNLAKTFADGFVLLDIDATSVPETINRALDLNIALGALTSDKRQAVHDALMARESQGSTAMGHGVAAPHAYIDELSAPTITFVRLAKPLNVGAPDGIPLRYLFVLLGPRGNTEAHLEALMAIARLMSDDEFRYEVGEANGPEELLAALASFQKRSAPSPENEKEQPISEGLTFSGRPFGGIVSDLKRRLPHFLSDFKDGLHPKALSSIIFLFFACLAPAVTFGGFMAVQTGGAIGAVEMLAATAVCGIIYALSSGTPLIILGGTGPLLIITVILYGLCQDMGIPFLPTYAWVGLWSALFMIILAVTDASALMRYFTRFTDEIFAALISLIFIYEAIKALYHIFVDHEVSHDTALLSLLLALGTFYIAMELRDFRRSRYLAHMVREFLSDFGPAIALAAMTAVAVALHEVELHTLAAPDVFGTTNGRPWLVNLGDAPKWVWAAAAVPALLVAVLVYLDQNITARIVNSKDHKLTKGESYHLDLGVVGVLLAVCSMFGLPWLVAATVRSLNHVRSLATTEEVVRGGESKEQIIHVRENRVTGLAIHVLVALSLLALPLLKNVPMAVLYGLFLYMGVVSMSGNQFFERLSLWIMDSNLYPQTHYTRVVPLRSIHAFTGVQLVSLMVLWVVKVSVLGILFPLFIALMVPVRFALDRFFPEDWLAALDAEEEPEEEADRF